MSLAVWRIVKKKHKDRAFDGEGARLYGGRWNNPGRRMIYTAESISLALLELLVHIENNSLLSEYTVIPVSIHESMISELNKSVLPDNWMEHPGPYELRKIGDNWLEALQTPVLKVPSAIVTQEWNYLINPEHPEFKSLKIGTAVPFKIDLRLLEQK